MDFSSIWNHQVALSLTDVSAATLSIACLYVGYIILQVRKKHDKKYPPFAPGGMWHHCKMATSSQYPLWLLDVSNQLSSRVFQLSAPIFPTRHLFSIGDADAMRSILTCPLSSRPEKIYANMRNITGAPTMLSLNGDRWHAKRKAASPAFSSNHIKRMTRVALEKTEHWVEDTLAVHSMTGTSFDVANEMLLIVLSALSETAYEYDMSKQEAEMFRMELHLALTEFARKSPLNPLRKLFGMILPERRRAHVAVRRLRALVRRIMGMYRKRKDEPNTTPPADGTIIRLVMESDAFATDKEKEAQLLEFLLVGHDTTAYSISWILMCLARHPEEQTKLRDSLSRLSSKTWNNSEQLKRVVKEGMRINPVARSIRVIGRDVMTSSGLLPRGSICSLQHSMLYRHPGIFDRADSFLPSRWENPTREMLDAFNPFALGKQNCIGRSLAQAETHSIVARICSEFELSVECEGSSDFSITWKPVGVRLKARRW